MKQHRFLVAPGQIEGELVSFTAEQWHQVHSVLRLRLGDRVQVFDGREPVDRVVELTGTATGRIVDTQAQAAEPRTRLVVYPSLLQRDTFEPVLQKLTEIGAAAIVPLLTAHGVVRAAADDRRQTRWRAILREATEQCGRGVVPSLVGGLWFAEAVERATAEGALLVAYEHEKRRSVRDALGIEQQRSVDDELGREQQRSVDELLRGERQRSGDELLRGEQRRSGDELLRGEQRRPGDYALGGEQKRRVDELLGGARRTVSLFVGPEGGFAPEEIACATAAGAHLVTLGPRILRSETASPVLAALVLYELGDLSCREDDA